MWEPVEPPLKLSFLYRRHPVIYRVQLLIGMFKCPICTVAGFQTTCPLFRLTHQGSIHRVHLFHSRATLTRTDPTQGNWVGSHGSHTQVRKVTPTHAQGGSR